MIRWNLQFPFSIASLHIKTVAWLCRLVSEPASVADGMDGTSKVFVKSSTQFLGDVLRWSSVNLVWNSLAGFTQPHLLLDDQLIFAYKCIPSFWSQRTTSDTGSTGWLNIKFSSKIALYCDNRLAYVKIQHTKCTSVFVCRHFSIIWSSSKEK